MAAVDTIEPEHDEDAWRVLRALRGMPRRLSWAAYASGGYREQPGCLSQPGRARARGRAAARVVAAHRDEFERYFVDEQWRIADGEAP